MRHDCTQEHSPRMHRELLSSVLHEQRERWTISMGGLRHMPVHPLKAWLFSEWWLPVASTGVSTSSVNISAGGAGHYHMSRIKVDQ